MIHNEYDNVKIESRCNECMDDRFKSLNQLRSSKMVRLHWWADGEKTKSITQKACKCSKCYINICMVNRDGYR